MNKHQYRRAIAALGLSQVRAAVFLGIVTRTSQAYALGETPVPVATDKLLRLMAAVKTGDKAALGAFTRELENLQL